MESLRKRKRNSKLSDEQPFKKQKTVKKKTMKCDDCEQKFTSNWSFKRHFIAKHSNERFECKHCDMRFTIKANLKRHQRSQHQPPQNEQQNNANQQQQQEDQHSPLTHQQPHQQDGNIQQHYPQEGRLHRTSEKTAINNGLKTVAIYPTDKDKHDLLIFFARTKDELVNIIVSNVKIKRGLKFYLTVHVRYIKRKDGSKIYSSPHFESKNQVVLQNETEIDLSEAQKTILEAFDSFVSEGSGWIFDEVLSINVNMAHYVPLQGSSYIPTPPALKLKHCLINVKNDDDKCFLWAVLSAIKGFKNNPQRVNQYKPFEGELNMTGISYPVQIHHIKKFESQNTDISINLYGYEKDEIFPLYISRVDHKRKIDLLILRDGDNSHYVWIKNMSRFLSHLTKHNGAAFYCSYCLHRFSKEKLLDNHLALCKKHEAQKIEMPNEKDNILSFKKQNSQLKIPFRIYADLECFLQPVKKLDENDSASIPTQKHVPSGFAYIVVSEVEKFCKPPVVYSGPDVIKELVKSLLDENNEIQKILDTPAKKIYNKLDCKAFHEANQCHICEKPLGLDKVWDHCHLTGKFRGAAHSNCNLQYKISRNVPVVFHNGKNYDFHFIIQELGQFEDIKKITCIPNNMEKYISFTVNNLVFLDSIQFLNASLESLVTNLNNSGGMSRFKHLVKHTEKGKENLLLRKGVYCYEFMTGPEKMLMKSLPPREAFYSSLTEETVSEEDYQYAQEIWRAFDVQTLGEYHDLYLKCDTLLLADVFDAFREICFSNYGLDCLHFPTLPSLSWQACLKMTGVQLELLTDPTMYNFCEDMKRGGISSINLRHCKANNEYMSLADYDPEEEDSFIVYLDANNLYGYAMCEPLPVSDFKWLTEEQVKNFDLSQIANNSERGYILDVDLVYPQEVHDAHNSYPLCPEKLTVDETMLSDYSKTLYQSLFPEKFQDSGKPFVYKSSSKLIPNLMDKTNYILHVKNLLLYIKLGMKLKRINRVLCFTQKPWIKAYIDFNTEKRTNAKNSFEKDFFKLANNSIFGKTLENVRNYKRVELISTSKEKKMKKLIASPAFKSFHIFNENLAAINMVTTKVKLNRPVYCGVSILDLSKLVMYSFHYETVKPVYGDKVEVCFSDTDSFCYFVKTEDLYEDLKTKFPDCFDFSDYSKTHTLYSEKNKKKLGFFKDENNSQIVLEFVGLKPKMYSILTRDGEKQTAKGIKKSVAKKYLSHELYKEALFGEQSSDVHIPQIRSRSHQVHTISSSKTGLSPFDDKRFILEDKVSTLAYGHYKIK